ncbi:MAG: ATP-grasp domain-containing protein [Dokdonella sp.]
MADQHVTLPSFHPNTYGEVMRRVIGQWGVTHYLPIIDPEILFASARPELPCIVMSPDAGFCRKAKEKSLYSKHFFGADISFPEVYPRDRLAGKFPCWAKDDGGFGGKSSRLILNEADLSEVPDHWFFQEHIAGREYTVDCFPRDDGPPICSVRERLTIKAGVCTQARLIRHSDLERIASALSSTMQRKSPFCFQAMEREDGSCAITDINPRLGAGTALSVANGLEFFAAHLARMFEQDPLVYLKRRHSTCYVTRQYAEFLSPAP